jgi:hypothetical protein
LPSQSMSVTYCVDSEKLRERRKGIVAAAFKGDPTPLNPPSPSKESHPLRRQNGRYVNGVKPLNCGACAERNEAPYRSASVSSSDSYSASLSSSSDASHSDRPVVTVLSSTVYR